MTHPFVSRRFWRSVGIGALIIVVLVVDTLLGVLDWANALFRKLLAAIGLGKLEEWLRKQPLWVGIIPLFPTALIYLFLKEREIASFVGRQFWHVAFYVVVSRLFEFGVVNFLVHLYAERLLKYRWIARLYNRYRTEVARARNLLRKQVWYRRATFAKQVLLTEWRKRRGTSWQIARRAVRKYSL